MFDRLVGLETEYALRFSPSENCTVQPTKFALYKALLAALRQRLPLAPARHFKEGVFAANGGAVWFEAERPSAGGGLVEGATPECRGPRQAIAWQRAQDRLLSAAARDADLDGELTLLKNSRDSQGNVYGVQENYEVTLASGWELLGWRLGLIALVPLAVATWLAILASIGATLFYFLAAALFYYAVRPVLVNPRPLALLLFGPDLWEGREPCIHIPRWLEAFLQKVTRIITGPLAFGLYLNIRCFAFRKYRRQLIPFLVSRSVYTGSGMLDDRGHFHLADKAMATNCVVGFGGMISDRPVFNMGHLFKAIYAEAWFHPARYCELMRPQQRLQLGLADANMAETAEFLRVGTTLLVLDAIEAGALPPVPRLRSPIRALHEISRDTSLTATVRSECAAWTALELQRFYWEACRHHAEQQPRISGEARQVLRLWGQVLDTLEEIRDGESPLSALAGEVDWATKQMILEEAGCDATGAERKKIDLRYHELSARGYYALLVEAGLGERVVEPAAVERAMRTPPPDSPATVRAHYIREFAGGDEPIAVNWRQVILGSGRQRKVIRIPGRWERMMAQRATGYRLHEHDEA